MMVPSHASLAHNQKGPMKTKQRIRLAIALSAMSIGSAQAAISFVSPPVEGFLGNTKTQVTTVHVGTTQISYDATGVDKLVVVYAAESGFNTQSVTNLTMSYNGVAMTLGRFQQFLAPPALTNDNGAVAIFYLDNPFQGAATFTAGFASTGGGANGGHVTIFGLAGTLDGIGAVAGTSTNDRALSPNASTSITTTGAGSLVIAGIQNSGANNVSGAIPNVAGGLTLGHNSAWGSNWGHAASGYQTVAGSGTTITAEFSTGTGPYVDVVAVEFLADLIPEPSVALLGGLGFLALLRRRR
jgi:hypothetical protein